MSSRTAKRGLQAFVDRYGTEAPEAIWTAALALLEKAATDARAVSGNRWRHYPQGEIRRLRRELAGAMMLARLAAALQEEENLAESELVRAARDAAETQRKADGRARTAAAQRARLRHVPAPRKRRAS